MEVIGWYTVGTTQMWYMCVSSSLPIMLRLIPVRRLADIIHFPGMEKGICSFHTAFL